MQNQLGKIQHVVHLMLENRSFDQMLGYLYSATERPRQGQAFSGLTGEEFNPDESGRPVAVGRLNTASAHLYRRPGADPGEGFYNTNLQLFSTLHPPRAARPGNKGFVLNFQSAIAYDLAHHYLSASVISKLR